MKPALKPRTDLSTLLTSATCVLLAATLPAIGALLAAVLLTTAPPARAQAADGCAQVEVQNVRPKQGQMMVAAFASADTYRKKPLTQLRLAAGDGATMRFQLCGLGASSEVALTLFQDLDSDGRMATNLVGMPSEPWGSSGTPGTFGPSWETGRVKLDGAVIVVKMSQ